MHSKNILSEARLIIEHEQKHLQQIENLAIPEKEAPEVAYTEADATFIRLQRPEKDRKLEIKIGIGYHGKEARYKSGPSQRLKEKFVYLGTGKDFMHSFSLKAEEELSLSKSKKHYFGGDGDTWITSGIRDCFPQATFILCRFHIFKRLRESLPGEKDKQRIIKGLLLSNQIDEALEKIDTFLLSSSCPKQRELLFNFYSYIYCNREGITNQVTL